ncbi:hypothetical protein [Streptomyces sp. NBC_00986]|nr:hypothetical protein OG504_25945 [Streptomyces sp. NBC_00986]
MDRLVQQARRRTLDHFDEEIRARMPSPTEVAVDAYVLFLQLPAS